MSKPRPLILDCDPGIDDFVAILMILAAPEKFDLLGITVTGGNVPLKYTTQNALKACELAGRTDVKVYAGCPAAMMRSHAYESDVHGETGLKGPELPLPTMKVQSQHAVDFLINTLMTSKEKVILATPVPLPISLSLLLVSRAFLITSMKSSPWADPWSWGILRPRQNSTFMPILRPLTFF